jgi:DNA adenine methylase
MIGPLPYIGGKRRLAPTIASLLPSHVTYVEPFAGGAQVFFHKPPSAVEVLNDLDDEIVNFLRVCQQHSGELVRWLQYAVASRRLHEWFSQQDTRLLTDIQRAARLLYLQKNSFGGRVDRRNFHFAVAKPQNYTPLRLPEIMAATARRLARVQLECLPYEQVIARYDRPTTCFYLDPPYVGRQLYRHNLSDADFGTLADRLKGLRGSFVLSINDHPISRRVFKGFHAYAVSLAYTSNRMVPHVTELLFSNVPLPTSARVRPVTVDEADSGTTPAAPIARATDRRDAAAV